MAQHPNVETLKRGYEAFAKGDMETLRSELFQPDIVWHQGGDNPTAGDYDGAEQVVGSHCAGIGGASGVRAL